MIREEDLKLPWLFGIREGSHRMYYAATVEDGRILFYGYDEWAAPAIRHAVELHNQSIGAADPVVFLSAHSGSKE